MYILICDVGITTALEIRKQAQGEAETYLAFLLCGQTEPWKQDLPAQGFIPLHRWHTKVAW